MLRSPRIEVAIHKSRATMTAFPWRPHAAISNKVNAWSYALPPSKFLTTRLINVLFSIHPATSLTNYLEDQHYYGKEDWRDRPWGKKEKTTHHYS